MADDSKTLPPSPPASEAPAPDPNEGPGKGKAFFDRAKSVAATGNFDYAIDMYIEGLFREPFNLDEHKNLREVAMRRKVAGAKSGGGLLGGFGGAKQKYKGKTPKEGLLNNEFTLARDVGNITAMLAIVRNADLLGLKDLIIWFGTMLKDANRTSKTPKVEIYTEIADIYAKYEEYDRACDIANEACRLKPNDADLASLSGKYAAEATMKRGKYATDGSFKDSIKDAEETKKLNEEENLGKSQEYLKKALDQAKAEYEANPKEMQVINKYAKALQGMEEEDYENQAIALLKKAYADTGIYRFKFQIGDIKITQHRRNQRLLKEAVKADPEDKEMLRELERIVKERLAFEVVEFKERVEQMPTDLQIKFEYGKRLWESKHYDEAIVVFQESQGNKRYRVESLHLLGRCFLIQHMIPEAVDTFKKSIEDYELAESGDKTSQELHYWYGRALEDNKQYAEAIDVYSKLIRWNIAYADARKRLTDLRAKLGG